MALIPPLMRVAQRWSVVDVPNERKVHTDVIPRIGGIAMMIGSLIPILLWLPADAVFTSLFLALTVLLVFGAWDDSRGGICLQSYNQPRTDPAFWIPCVPVNGVQERV